NAAQAAPGPKQGPAAPVRASGRARTAAAAVRMAGKAFRPPVVNYACEGSTVRTLLLAALLAPVFPASASAAHASHADPVALAGEPAWVLPADGERALRLPAADAAVLQL